MKNHTARRIRARAAAIAALALITVGSAASASQAAPLPDPWVQNCGNSFACTTFAGYGQGDSGHDWVENNYGLVYLASIGVYDGHNCTRYVAFRLAENGYVNTGGWHGAGGNWYAKVPAGTVVNGTPAIGSVAEWPSDGHVAYVDDVTFADGKYTIYTSEDNFNGNNTARKIFVEDGANWPAHFIHLRDVVEAQTPPHMRGLPKVDEILEVDAGTWPLETTSVTYEWFSNGTSVGTGTSYRVQQGDVGASLKVVETATISGHATKPAESTSVTVSAEQFEGMAIANVLGVPHVGNTLSADLDTSMTGITPRYQWKRDGSPIEGAYDEEYDVTTLDLGAQLSVAITLTKTGYVDKTVNSGRTAVVEPAGVQISDVTISGTAEFGSVLYANVTVTTPGATTVYQWYRNGFPISGAQGPSYTVTATDIGTNITVTVTASKATYLTSTRISQPVVPGAATISMSGVTLGGTARVFSTLTANVSVSTAGTSVAYQWYRNGTTLVGTGSSYSPTIYDNGAVISVNVTVSKSGYATAYRNSSGVSIAPALMGTFYATAQGTNRVEYTMSAAVTSATPGVTLTYYWKRNGSTVSTGSSYTLQPADIGQNMTLTVTGTKSGYATSTSTYGIGTTAGYLSYSFSGAPASISGTAKVGKTLTAVTGLQTSGVTITYRWYRDGSPLSATGRTYTLVSADKGKKITVRIYFDKLGHQATSSLSTAVTVTA